MRRLLMLMALALPLILFAGCDFNLASTGFSGTWNGSWAQISPNGTTVDKGAISVDVADTGAITGVARSGLYGEGTVVGSVDDDRQLLLTISYPSGSSVSVYRAEGNISASSPKEIAASLRMVHVDPPSMDSWTFKINVTKRAQ